jgi:hypothetical protein
MAKKSLGVREKAEDETQKLILLVSLISIFKMASTVIDIVAPGVNRGSGSARKIWTSRHVRETRER